MPSRHIPDVDILVVTFADMHPVSNDGQIEYEDLILKELWTKLDIPGDPVEDPVRYSGGGTEFLAELRAHKLHQETSDRYWRLHPRLNSSAGELRTGSYGVTRDGKKICVFSSDLRLNTDGPTMPVLRLMNQIVQEANPKFVLHVGLGGAVRATQQAGDVVVTSSGRFELRGELAGASVNERTVGGQWAPDEEMFHGLSFPSLREPALLPPSPHYLDATREIQPPEHTPVVRVEALPVVTRPRLTEPRFDIATPYASDKRVYYCADSACAVDMDAAPVGLACGSDRPCGFVLGLATPAIRHLEGDYRNSLRNAWAEHMMELFTESAARNAAAVAHRIVSTIGTSSGPS